MRMDKGDRVIATENIPTGGFLSSPVRKGTKGVITKTGSWSNWFEVVFEDQDDAVRCKESQIAKAGR